MKSLPSHCVSPLKNTLNKISLKNQITDVNSHLLIEKETISKIMNNYFNLNNLIQMQIQILNRMNIYMI